METRPRDLIAPGALGVALLANYVMHKTGWANTDCMGGRRVFRTDTKPGKAAALGAMGYFAWWFVPHFINGPLYDESPHSEE